MSSGTDHGYWLQRTAVAFGAMVLSGATGIAGVENLAPAAGAAGCPWYLPLSGRGPYAASPCPRGANLTGR